MKQDEIIEMVRIAEDKVIANKNLDWKIEFAKLVAAAAASKEREQIIAITETQEFSRMYGEFTPSAYDLVKAIRARGEA